MDQYLTDLVLIVDESGSMDPLAKQTISSFNELLQKQKAASNKTPSYFLTMPSRHNFRADAAEVVALNTQNYRPGGCTALYDAVGETIEAVGKDLSDTPESERPGKVVVAIITDGSENASSKYRGKQIKQMITHQEEKYSWDFLFFGANIDAIAVAGDIGIDDMYAFEIDPTEKGIYEACDFISCYIDDVNEPSKQKKTPTTKKRRGNRL